MKNKVKTVKEICIEGIESLGDIHDADTILQTLDILINVINSEEFKIFNNYYNTPVTFDNIRGLVSNIYNNRGEAIRFETYTNAIILTEVGGLNNIESRIKYEDYIQNYIKTATGMTIPEHLNQVMYDKFLEDITDMDEAIRELVDNYLN